MLNKYMAQEKACEIPTIPRVDMLDVARKKAAQEVVWSG